MMQLRSFLRKICGVLLIFNGLVVAVASDAPIGSVKGRVNVCSQGGIAGMQVYVPGRQLIVITGEDGQFLFDRIPAGEYRFHYVHQGKLLNTHGGVKVYAGRESDIGEISFCNNASVKGAAASQDPGKSNSSTVVPPVPATGSSDVVSRCETEPASPHCIDVDKDGVELALDCNDQNIFQRPGLPERCDGVDNNCNGVVDDMAPITIENGIGACVQGKIIVQNCVTGFSNCDQDASNGCEVDLMNDAENCGACGNECAAMDLCRLGSC